MPKKLQHLDALSERRFKLIKWSLTAVSTVVTSVFIQILHTGNL